MWLSEVGNKYSVFYWGEMTKRMESECLLILPFSTFRVHTYALSNPRLLLNVLDKITYVY